MLTKLYKQLATSKDLHNGYSAKVEELHKEIKNLAFNILHSSISQMEQYAVTLAERSAQLEEYKAELKLLEIDIEITEADIAEFESEVK